MSSRRICPPIFPEIPEACTCFAGLPLPTGVSLPATTTRRYFAEAAQYGVMGAPSATSGGFEAMDNTVTLEARLRNTEYNFAGQSTYTTDTRSACAP